MPWRQYPGPVGVRPANLVKYRGGYKYQLSETYVDDVALRPVMPLENRFISLLPSGRLTLWAGYAWDGATWFVDFDWIMRGSVVHDALYQLIAEGMLPPEARRLADDELRRICTEDKAPPGMAWVVWSAVRMFGGSRVSRGERSVSVSPARRKTHVG